ncbi:MAG: uncharacterized 2Fe-2S/4Fe-4S cluster protein (DUF4445 family) [Flavobacterium sp.]|jgi:uncharacterized 2Fe-2S/4Fe-4S cluster protein (DUF4445 family)
MNSEEIKHAKIVFTPSGKRSDFPIGTTILEAAQKLGVDVDSVCGGRAKCGRCEVICAEGEFPKHGIRSGLANLNGVSDAEQRFSDKIRALTSNRRLGCQARVLGDLVIDVPPESQVHRQIVRKAAEYRDIKLDASMHLHYIEVVEADLEIAGGDLERICDALSQDWQLEGLTIDSAVLPNLQPVLRKGKWQVTVGVHQQKNIFAIWPGLKSTIYGIALDIGSTTIASHLCDLTTGEVLATSGMMNPQIRFGEDLMSRVSYVMMHPEGSMEMTVAVRQSINTLVKELCIEADIDAGDIVEMTVAANPIMHHLYLGLSPVELGSAPFALATEQALNLNARDLDLDINVGGRVYLLPCIAGHVGADAAAMILAEEPHHLEDNSLVVDVGTNAEIVLGNKTQLFACSSPTGPAFEGAQISCGQRAAPGAIERVRIDPETLEPRFTVIGSELWSNEAGFIESVKGFGVTGICGSGIIEVVAEMFLSGVLSEDGVIDGALTSKNPRIFSQDRTWSYSVYEGDQQIAVTQNDIRQIQLAKAALYAGAKLLMDKAGITKVDRIRLAGAFGSHIDPKYAMVLGLIPDCELSRVESAGNAAGTGARIALLNVAARTEIETVVREITKIETATETKFQEYFIGAMAFPHKVDDFPNLFSEVEKPKAKIDSGDGKSRRRGRRRA